jgi:branched-chain amino acid transport system substrate-binding protein
LRKLISAATLILAVTAGAAHAQENIKIGLIMPLTGNSASAGQQAKAAVELAAEIVNGAYPEFATLPLASSVGLPNLKGAKLKIIAADNQNNPSTGQKQTVRLITEEQVVAPPRRISLGHAGGNRDRRTIWNSLDGRGKRGR